MEESLIMKKFGVIFDMDGVIIDSEPVYRSLNEQIYKRLGIKVEDSFKSKYIGVTARTKWKLIKEHYNLSQSIEELLKVENEVFSQAEWDYRKILYPGVKPLLKKLQMNAVPLALATSSGRLRVNEVLEQCNLAGYFKKVITGDEVKNGKPDPEIFLLAAKLINIPPENCIVIEDSYNGLVAAKDANMYGVGIRHPEIQVDLSIADIIVESLEEIEFELIGKEE